MIADRHGNPLSGATPAAAARLDEAVGCFNLYRGDPIAALDAATAESPAFAQAHLLKAWLLAIATEPAATAAAHDIAAAVGAMRTDDREASQLAALRLLLAGRWNAAATALDHHGLRHPRDLVALQVGHLLDFFRGNARALRDRIARALAHWSAEDPGWHAVLAMHAFGLEETADYGRAEETGRHALDLEPDDAWAHHAVAHVMEMQGRSQDGIGWMTVRQAHWARPDSFMKVHNAWHGALCHLDLGEVDRALALYDGPIRAGRSQVALDLVDASALLWRLRLCGRDLGDRWTELAASWDAHADGRTYPFNDWHAAMAYIGAGRDDRLDALDRSLERDPADPCDTAIWGREIARPLIRGFTAFHHGDYRGCIEVLHPMRFVANAFGGSHAQRDVIDWTLAEAALRSGDAPVAAGFAHERSMLKPHSAMIRAMLRRATRAPS